jgi:hypothetical protein
MPWVSLVPRSLLSIAPIDERDPAPLPVLQASHLVDRPGYRA